MQLKDPHRQLLRGTKLPTVWQKMPIFCKVRTLRVPAASRASCIAAEEKQQPLTLHGRKASDSPRDTLQPLDGEVGSALGSSGLGRYEAVPP